MALDRDRIDRRTYIDSSGGLVLEIDPYVADVLSEVRVLKLSTATKNGKLNTRPMSGNWSPATGQITVTVPVAYPQKVYNVRRYGR